MKMPRMYLVRRKKELRLDFNFVPPSYNRRKNFLHFTQISSKKMDPKLKMAKKINSDLIAPTDYLVQIHVLR